MTFREDLYGTYVSGFKAERRQPSHAWWEHKYLPLLRDLPRDASILEIGCGSGELLGFLQQRGFTNSRGVDISPEQVALAQDCGLPVVLADAFETLSQARRAFDAIIAVDVLEHLTREELLRLASLLHQALSPGGRLLVQTANGAALMPGQVIFGDLTHLTIFTPESLAQLLQPCGFTDLAFYETGPIPLRMRGRLNVIVWQLIKAAANALRSIETGKRQAIWTENFICLARRPR